MKEILSKILERIKPNEQEENDVRNKVDSILKKINKTLKDAKAVLGGSGVKGTWLKDAYDADIFVKFRYNKYKDKSGELSNILERIVKKKFKITRLHGSRDYFQMKEKNFTFEIIPILDIKKAEQAKNITDVSPLHADWVNKKGKNFKDDIRLAKQFCKSAGVYGAESYIQGFSGYICEILIIYYKGFQNLIKNAAKWKERVVIDVENYWKGKNILMELNKSKIHTPLIVIDPVQAGRNAAAALSKERYEEFKEYCKKFLKNPSEKFFEIKELSKEELKKKAKNNELILIDALPKKGKKDIVGCKLIKAMEFINKKLKQSDFKVIDCGWQWNKNALFYFIIKKEKLSEKVRIIGPPIELEEHAKKFKEKYKKVFIEKGRMFAEAKRNFREPRKLIEFLKYDGYIKDKIDGFELEK